MNSINVRVAAVERVTPLVKHFTLVREDGGKLAPFSGGSHVVVSMDAGGKVYRNAYSLMGAPENTDAYHISVRRQERSRGGSVFMHDKVTEGSRLQITMPTNLFAISRMGRKHILIAGGIGITPFMSQLFDIERNGFDYELHYAFRSPEHGAFADQLKARNPGWEYRFYDHAAALAYIGEHMGGDALRLCERVEPRFGVIVKV